MSTVLFDTVKTMSKITDSVLVGYSGGKESLVVLDICFRYFKKVQPYHLYYVPGLSWHEKMYRWCEERYGLDVIKIPCDPVSMFFRYGIYTIPDETFPIISQNDIWKYLRIRSGIWYIAQGERVNDSLARRAWIKNSSSIDMKTGRLFPVSMWKTQEIYDYIKHHKLYLPEEQKRLKHSFRIFDAEDLTYIKEHHPEDYEKIVHVFPLAGALTVKHKIKIGEQSGKEQIPGI